MGSNTLIIIGAIILIALVVGGGLALPAIIQEIRDAFQTFRDAFLDDWGDIFNGNQTDGTDFIGFGITVYFEDGTVKTYEPSERYAIIPLTVLVDAEPITRADWDLFAKLDYVGTLTSLQASGNMELNSTTGHTGTLDSKTLSGSLGVPPSGTWFKIDGFSKTAQQIEDWFEPSLQGTLKAYGDVTLTATFADGNFDANHGTCYGGIHFVIDYSRIELMSLELRAQAIP